MTKIKIDDGKEAKEKNAPAKKTVKKIIVTEAPSIHSSVQKSTTLSRRYVKKPAVAKKAAIAEKPTVAKKAAVAPKKPANTKKIALAKKAEALRAKKAAEAKKAAAAKAARLARIEAARAAKRAAKLAKKDRAIRSASTVIAKMNREETVAAKKSAPKMEKQFKKKSKAGRIFLALLCSAGTVAALVAFVHFSIPDLSVRVAAIQTGIDAAYPTFVPRGYSLSDVTSDREGVVIMTFKNAENASFTLSEEKSTWDSTALLNNYVKKTYPSDFTTLREQGITIYVRGEKASWVNGGLLYKIDASGKYLTKEQIRNIATSL